MSYPKFDDRNKKVSTTARKAIDATAHEAMRRAIQGVVNRVLGGSNGTQGPLITAGIAIGSTHGLNTTNAVTVSINGVQVAVGVLADVDMPAAGTQAVNTTAKFLLSVGTAGTGLVSGPANIITDADYTTVALAAAAAKLPDLPDGHCALGYVTYRSGSVARVWSAASVVDAASSTGGTAAYTNLLHMPYED